MPTRQAVDCLHAILFTIVIAASNNPNNGRNRRPWERNSEAAELRPNRRGLYGRLLVKSSRRIARRFVCRQTDRSRRFTSLPLSSASRNSAGTKRGTSRRIPVCYARMRRTKDGNNGFRSVLKAPWEAHDTDISRSLLIPYFVIILRAELTHWNRSLNIYVSKKLVLRANI